MTSIIDQDKGFNLITPLGKCTITNDDCTTTSSLTSQDDCKDAGSSWNQCDDSNDNIGAATTGGVFNGIAGLVGLGGFWDPIKQNNLTSATNDLVNQKTKVKNIIDQEQQAIKKLEDDYIKDQMKQITAIEKFHQELEDDKIQINTLLIQIISGILLIIIIYLIFL